MSDDPQRDVLLSSLSENQRKAQRDRSLAAIVDALFRLSKDERQEVLDRAMKEVAEAEVKLGR